MSTSAVRSALDGVTVALMLLGAVLLASALIAMSVMLGPGGSAAPPPTATVEATPEEQPADHVATVLRVDAAAGAGTAARVGDHVDVLAYFPKQVTGRESVTRVLVADVLVLAVARDGSGAGLTLSVPQPTALLLQEAQALGAKPFVVLRSTGGGAVYPRSLGDSELAERLAGNAR
jgi:Flp pilus assembly protein RcpC/CpaB